jgi:imidazole glycerol-phosphate synthase subunit HisH
MTNNNLLIGVIDCGIGNLHSICRSIESLEYTVVCTSSYSDLKKANSIVLPGVGAFGKAMHNLQELDLISPILELIANGVPFLGICLGMQLLFSESYEFGLYQGLNIFEGKVSRIPNKNNNGENIKVPHIGWNKVELSNNNINNYIKPKLESLMYFVHSYYVNVVEPNLIVATTTYNSFKFASIVKKNNVLGMQFHPEKSGNSGINLLSSWLKNNDIISLL